MRYISPFSDRYQIIIFRHSSLSETQERGVGGGSSISQQALSTTPEGH